jgi:RNA polymerase sigma factor (sigma-70 family)
MENQTNFYRSRWARACEENNQHLTSYARRLANGNIDDANDLVQETIFRVMAHGCNPSRINNVIAYLCRIMHNAWTRKRMKERRDSIDSLDDLLTRRALENQPAINPDVLQVLENQEFQEDFKVKKGPLNAREMLILELYLDGYKCHEIAAELSEDKYLIGVELNAVRTKVRYRLKRKSKIRETNQPPRGQI